MAGCRPGCPAPPLPGPADSSGRSPKVPQKGLEPGEDDGRGRSLPVGGTAAPFVVPQVNEEIYDVARWPDVGVALWAELERNAGRFALLCGERADPVAAALADLRGAPPLQVGRLLSDAETRHPDRIYHRVVSYYVSAGLPVPMTAGAFYSGLESHFNERDGMYFRPDQVETYERKKMTFKELATSELFVTDEKSAVSWLRQQLKRKPQKMSDIQPEYLKEIATAGERPDQLPDLRELLEQNFVQDEATGAWSVPDPRKLEHLEQLRNRDLLRTFDTYAAGTGMLTRFRGEAVLAGFKKAWADSEYATIVKVGARLPQEYLVELPAVLAYVRNATARLNR